MSIKPEAIIYTDGSCNPNPGPGGWGAIVIVGEQRKRLSGGSPKTTNNRMELTGVINALSSLRGPHIVTLYTDSEYIVNAFVKHWIDGWKQRGWAKTDGELKNKDLWQLLDKLAAKHTITWNWVKGHAGNKYNEECDKMAAAAAQSYQNGNEDNPALLFGMEQEMEPPTEEEAKTVVNETPAEAPAAESTQDNDTIKYFQRYMERVSIEKNGIPHPCGGEPWCEHCRGMEPEDGSCRCAEAYIAYLKERDNMGDG